MRHKTHVPEHASAQSDRLAANDCARLRFVARTKRYVILALFASPEPQLKGAPRKTARPDLVDSALGDNNNGALG